MRTAAIKMLCGVKWCRAQTIITFEFLLSETYIVKLKWLSNYFPAYTSSLKFKWSVEQAAVLKTDVDFVFGSRK